MSAVEVLGGCDCGGKVMLDVEAVSPRCVVDRCVPTADVDAGRGLITDDLARWPNCIPLVEWRKGSPDSCQQQ